MTTYYAELHCHTTCSDGLCTPEELVEKAIATGFRALAITDHDNMAAYRSLYADGYNNPSLQLIPGIEFSCEENGREVHCLGFYLRADHPDVLAYEDHSRSDRERRAQEMVSKLNAAGIRISYAEVEDEAAGAHITRPHLASILVRRGYAQTLSDAFSKWLERGRIGYAARSRYSIRDAVMLTRAAGGVLIVAHPGRTYQDPRLFLSLITLGIDGIEVNHPSHWTATKEYYRLLADRHALLITGGSDYHGSREYDEQNFGEYGATQEMVEALRLRSLQRQIHGEK